MSGLTFGIPKRSSSSDTVEKFPTTPVVTIEPAATEKGKSSKIRLNATAISTLGLDCESDENQYVSFAFNTGRIYIANVTTDSAVGEADKYRVYKNGSISNKKLHNYIGLVEGYGVGEYELIPEKGAYLLRTPILISAPESTEDSSNDEIVVSEDVSTSENTEEAGVPAAASEWV